jgi:2-polyprenyl-3-methyl-5-hydroxy-6-metoxy-1,4-benzoquinol methylase
MTVANCHIYEYAVDLTGQTAPAHVVHLVGFSKRVLEIGCGPGSITRALAQHGQCRVTGLELDLESIKKAAPYCETVIQADLNSEAWPHLFDGADPFDVVVAADVLEHLYDPWTTLKRMASLIGPNGYLVISLPHVGHAGVMSCIINSDFEYRDCGLLDRTHIRFFGVRNMEALFAQAELKIVEVKYVILPPENTDLAENWSKLSVTVQDAIQTSPYADVYQVVVKAVPLSYPGDAIPLAPPEQKFTPPVMTNPASWRKRIAKHLSPRQKQHIRSSLKLFGINL